MSQMSEKWPKNDKNAQKWPPKWLKMAKNARKMAENGWKWL
jgi:hypothetical protein